MTELTKREAAEPANRQPPRKRTRCAVLGSPGTELGIGNSATEADIDSTVIDFDPERYGLDVWTEVAKHLCPVGLLNLSAACRWLHHLLDDGTVWRHAFFRDLNLPAADTNHPPQRSWRLLYIAAFDGSHAYWLRQSNQHLNAYRIGAFMLDSPQLLVTAKLPLPKLPLYTDDKEHTIESTGVLVLNNARGGVWITDIHLLKCPLCDGCDGRMLVLDARHCDLFFEKSYRNGTWEYFDVGRVEQEEDTASCAVFNAKRLSSFITDSWTKVSDDLDLQSCTGIYGAAVSSKLHRNTGLVSSFQAMRDPTGQIVSIRISQQVLK